MDSIIKGFVNMNEKFYPFQYDNQLLNIFPLSQEEVRKHNINQLKKLNNQLKNISNEWIPQRAIKGETSDGKDIIFICNDVYLDKAEFGIGFENYEVLYFFLYEQTEEATYKIDGVVLTGEEIDLFYSPQKIFETSAGEVEAKSFFTVKSSTMDSIDLPAYTLKSDVKIQPSISIRSTMNTLAKVPLTAKTEITLNFSEQLNLEDTIDIIYKFKLFLQFICYRRNVFLDKVSTFSLVNSSKKPFGEIVLNENVKKELNTTKRTKILSYDLLQNDSSKILQAISDGSMYFEHLCETIDDTASFNISRIIHLFVAFEREYRNIYGVDVNRSETYINTKKELCTELSRQVEASQGKQKKYLIRFLNLVENSDNSFSEKIKVAIHKNEVILQPFLLYFYSHSDKDLISIIAERMNKMRNDVAHGNLDLQIEPINLSDFKIIEFLPYIIRLNDAGVNPQKIQKMMCNLFNLRSLPLN